MKAENPKENKCISLFSCGCSNYKDCAYSTRRSRTASRCEYKSLVDDECNSCLARANAMVLALKDMGFEVELKGGKE